MNYTDILSSDDRENISFAAIFHDFDVLQRNTSVTPPVKE